MKTNKKKNFKPFKILITICLVYLVCSSFYSVIARINDYKSDIKAVNTQLKEEEKTNKTLQEKKLNLHSEENYKEIAKKTLGLVEPGDKVYINSNDN